MSGKEVSSRSGIGFTGLLTIVFIVLKLTGTIAWPWVWVLLPLVFSIAIGIILFTIVLLIAAMK